MKKLFLLLVVASTPAFSALAPLYQSMKEIQSILNNPQFTENLPTSAQIKDIKKVTGGYLIVTSSHTMKVDVEYQKQSMVGPAKYKLCFHKPIDI